MHPRFPTGEYGPEWQNCMSWHDPLIVSDYDVLVDFQVTERLPNVTWSLARGWAGNISVQRVGHPNDTLLFWRSSLRMVCSPRAVASLGESGLLGCVFASAHMVHR